MKYTQYSNNLGEYYPAFFQMVLKDVDGEIDLNTCTDKEFALFFHEYIHFLQDLTTTYGLTRCFYYGEYIQAAVNDIYKFERGPIEVPIRYDSPTHFVKIADVITDSTMGDCKADIEQFSIVNVELSALENLPIESEYVGSIDVVDVETSDGDIFTFGAFAIKESIAYILERLITIDYEVSHELPYCAAEKITKFVFPEFGKNLLNVLALCDCSLMFSNPAAVFYKTLLQLKQKGYVPAKPHDLYYQLKDAKVGIAEYTTDPFSHFKVVAEEARKKFKSYFNVTDHPEMHLSFHRWVDRLIDFSVKTRLEEPTFLLDLAYGGYVRTNDTFQRLVNNLGSPLIRNKRQEYFSMKPNGISGWSCEVMKSVMQIHDLLHDGMFQCGLYPWCVNSDRHFAGSDGFEPINPSVDVCLKRPWERCDCLELCPFAMLWKNWNLMGYVPINSDGLCSYK